MDDRLEAQTAVANFLIERVRQDRYPSSTHMDILESFVPAQVRRDYLNVLLEKVLSDEYPSIPMLRRIVRVAEGM